MKTIVLLTKTQALWFRIDASQIVARHEESIAELQNLQDAPHADRPWVDETKAVHLIIQSDEDEVEWVALPDSKSAIVRHAKRRALLEDIRQACPDTVIDQSPAEHRPDVLCLTHLNLTAEMRVWLEGAEAAGLTVISARTLHAALASQFPSDIPCRLLVVTYAERVRYILTCGNAVLFVRISDAEVITRSRLQETVSHLRENNLLPGDVVVHVAGLASSVVDGLRNVDGVAAVEGAADIVSTQLDNTSKLSWTKLKSVVGLTSGQINTAGLQEHQSLTDQALQQQSVRHVARTAGKSTQISGGAVLDKHCGQVMLMRLRVAAVTTVLIATYTAAIAVQQGLHDAKLRAQYLQLQHSLQQDISSLQNEAQGLHTNFDKVAVSLLQSRSLQAAVPADPEDVLFLLAGALTRFDQISLSHLSWETIDKSPASDSPLVDSANGAASVMRATAASHRRKLPAEDDMVGYLMVTVRGVVAHPDAQASTLRQLQAGFDSFVENLAADSMVVAHAVGQSPVDAIGAAMAIASPAIANARSLDQPSTTGSAFVLHLWLRKDSVDV